MRLAIGRSEIIDGYEFRKVRRNGLLSDVQVDVGADKDFGVQ